jgi:NAD(P)-dependent dehydrogenase (short-subunit alcohol dehydrogenase family)
MRGRSIKPLINRLILDTIPASASAPTVDADPAPARGGTMAGIALTGSASGIGAATRRRLELDGRSVIGVDRRDAEVLADLGTPAGREAAVAGVLERCDGSVDGYAGFAGVPATVEPPAQLVHVSYFGSVAMLEGLRDALARGGPSPAVAVSSCAATVAPVDETLVAACLDGDEAGAAARVEAGGVAYASVKLALARWVRRNAPAWAADGIRLNALAPGNTLTPLTETTLADPELGPLMRAIPVPAGRWAEPDEIAAAAQWMLSDDSWFMVGSVLFVDGGTDALVRPDTF